MPAALYADPAEVCSKAETGDQVPVKLVKPSTCFECVNVRPSLYGPPCAIHACASPETARCRLWERA